MVPEEGKQLSYSALPNRAKPWKLCPLKAVFTVWDIIEVVIVTLVTLYIVAKAKFNTTEELK